MKWSKLAKDTVVKPGSEVVLARDFDSARKPDSKAMTKADGRAQLEAGKQRLFELQDRFYAQSDRALLIVLQAIDAAGKDSTVKHVMSGVNPEGIDVYSFKAPTSGERVHDYLWRHNLVLPALGRIAVFNRSHYENVLATRVHPELLWPVTPGLDPQANGFWRHRYRQINDWERHLTDNGTTIVKLFLNVSKEEQGRRFLERADNPDKNWKFSKTDLVERGYWDAYQEAFDHMLTHTSTDYAPWHVIPADHKWFSHLSTFAVLLDVLEKLDPQYPVVSDQDRAELAVAAKELKTEIG